MFNLKLLHSDFAGRALKKKVEAGRKNAMSSSHFFFHFLFHVFHSATRGLLVCCFSIWVLLENLFVQCLRIIERVFCLLVMGGSDIN